VKHQLSGSEYPDRVRQCAEALACLQQVNPNIRFLREANLDLLDEMKESMSAEAYNRGKHNIAEDSRTLQTVEALKRGDFNEVGRLMSESHESLKTLYDVSCRELDVLQSLALQVAGVYGSRMTGAGFGGCTVTLITKESVPFFREYVSKNYTDHTGQVCTMYEVTPSAGSGVFKIE
jgi:galactokinase